MIRPLAATTCDTTTDEDCDDDGLSNDAEVYKLGTSAYDVDSDSDYISDKTEVEGFSFGGKEWYLDPLNPDSNGDGILDGLECVGLKDVDETTETLKSAFTAAACTNSDSDSTPDLFDFDNDGDGVPDEVDDSPFNVIGSTSTGLTDGKLDFSLIHTGADLPIYVDFVVRPTNLDHLWYNNNVLDWPSADTDGQITRVFDTTFADFSDYSALDKASNGDIVLVPLLEFEITYNAANPSASLPISATYSNTTASIPDYSDLSWLDTDALDELGISVNEGEDDQSLLLWVPLSAVEDETGDTPVAWVGRMVYRPPTGSNSWGNAQQVRLNWMVQALTDTCDVSTNSTTTESAEVDYDTWCADENNWTTSATIIQTYYDDFMVTGLTVREDHGAKAAIIAQPDDVGNSSYEDYLWHLAASLEDALIGAERKSDGNRFSVDDIADYLATWGVSGLNVTNFTLADQLELADVGTTETTDILNTVFASAAENETTTLLFAGEETARTIALGDSDVTINDNDLTLDLTAATLDTHAILRWAPYVYEGDSTWDLDDASTYLDDLETALTTVLTDSELDSLVSGDTISDYDDARIGAVALAQAYYLALYNGLGTTVEIDDVDASTTSLGAYTLAGTAVTNIVSALLSTMQDYYAELSVVDALTSAATDTTAAASALSASFADSLSLLLESLGTAVNGEASTALTLALAEVGDFYKTAEVDTTDLTSITAISAMEWASTAATHSMQYVAIYGAIKMINGLSSMIYTVKLAGIANAALLAEPGSAAMNAAESATRSSKAWAVATLVVLTAIYLTLYFTGHYDNALQRSAALADTIAKIIVAVIMAAIAVIPVVGWLIVGMIALIDTLMMLICEVAGVEAGSTVDLWVCSGISGTVTQGIVYLIFDQYLVVDLSRDDRLDIALDSPTISQKGDNDGYVVGNELNINAMVTNTVRVADLTGLGSVSDFVWQAHDYEAMLRKSAFGYTLQNSEVDHHDALSLGQVAWTGDVYYADLDGWQGSLSQTFTPAQAIPLATAGLNQDTRAYLSESVYIPGVVCWGFLIQGCERQDYKDTFHTNLGDDFVFDVLPATLDDFTELTLVSNNSYRLAWDSRFPTLYDADGDGLISQAKGGADPNDSLWDTDGDGLSDYWELSNGYAAEEADYDNDNLSDYWEEFYGTNAYAADSDNDGLTDSEEFYHSGATNPYSADNLTWTGGWTVVYDYDSSAHALSTIFSADPNDADSDDDTILDKQEHIYGYNPNLASVLNVLSLDAEVSATAVAISDTVSYSATVTNELDNRVAYGLLQAEFPVDTVQSTQVMDTLYAQESTTMQGTITAPNVSATTASSVTIRAGAIIANPDTDHALWLHLNETSTAAGFADDAMSAEGPHNATCNGSSCPTINADDSGYLDFDGSDEITVLDHDELDLQSFTLSLWVNQDDTTAQTWWSKGTTGLTLSHVSGGKLKAQIYLSDCVTPVSVTAGSYLSAGVWNNAIVTYDGATLKLYLNGANAGSATAASICMNGDDISIGESFKGSLDEIELYEGSLSSDEVAGLFNKPVFALSSYGGPNKSLTGNYDESAYGQGLLVCGTTSIDCPDKISAIIGNGYSFDGAQGIKVEGGQVHRLGKDDAAFGMAMWIYPEDGYSPDDDHFESFGQMILGNANNALSIAGRDYNYAYPSLYLKGQKLMVRFGHVGGSGYCEATTSNNNLTLNAWQHMALAFDGSQFKLYVNGALRETFSGTNCAGYTPYYGVDDFYIGHGLNPAIYFSQLTANGNASNDELFIQAVDTTIDTTVDNDNDSRSVVYQSAGGEVDANTTLTIGKWAESNTNSLDWLVCNSAGTPSNGCINGTPGQNSFTNSGAAVQYTNYADIGSYVKTFTSASNDGDANKTYAIDLTYKVYNNGFKGKLDDIRVYRSSLSAADVTEVYEAANRTLELAFDEAPGQDIFANTTGNEYDGTCSSAGFGGNCPDSGIPGRANQAARFDGATSGLPADDDGNNGVADYITLADANTLGLYDSRFTVLAWVKADTVSGTDSILGTTTQSTQKGLQLALVDGKPTMNFYNVSTTGSTTLAVGQWYHLAWVYDKDNSTQKIYVNGVLDATETGKSAFLGDGTVYVGKSLSGNPFDGMIDHLVIAPNDLSQSEIQAIMKEAPVLNLHLDEDLDTTTFTDDSIDGNDATCTDSACPEAGSKGQMREAPVFDGGDTLTVPADSSLNLSDFSISLWVKPTKTGSAQTLVQKADSNGTQSNFDLSIQPQTNSDDDTLPLTFKFQSTCTTSDMNWQSITSSGGLIEEQWNQVIATYDSSTNTAALYINGALDTSTTLSSSICSTSSQSVKIGSNLVGMLDEVAIYGSALTAAEADAIYQYQAAWYDITYQQLLTVDVDNPIVSIAVGSSYAANESQWLTISAADVGSSIKSVKVGILKPSGQILSEGYATQDNEAWLYQFNPEGEGEYSIIATATDEVGNETRVRKQLTIDVIDPTVTIDSGYTSAPMVPVTNTTGNDTVNLQGWTSDPGQFASGIITNAVTLELLDWQGVSVDGAQATSVTEHGRWSIDYPFPSVPYGEYAVQMRNEDNVGNVVNTTVGTIWMDDLGPTADIALSNSDMVTESVATLTGVVSDLPYPTENKVLQLHFEEANGATTFNDSSENHFSASCSICPTAGQSGAYGSAITLDGSGQQIEVSDSSQLDFDDNFTIALWMKPSNWYNNQQAAFVAKGDGSANADANYLFGKAASDDQALRFAYYNGGWQDILDTSGATYTDDQWYHVALVVNTTDNQVSFYRDGELLSSQSADFTNHSITITTSSLVIGNYLNMDQHFAGSLDEVVVYNRALSSEELYDIANPLDTAVASAQIRFRHASDGEQGENEGTWYDVTLAATADNPSTGSGQAFATWSYPLPSTLEGSYKIDFKVTDELGNSNYIPNAWSGDIDVVAPVVTITYNSSKNASATAGGSGQVQCAAEDYNISTTDWACHATGLTEVAEDATWFTDIFSPTTKTTGLTSNLETITFDRGVTTISATACDAYGHCTTKTIDRCDYKIVSNANDSGTGSLRQAISDVCNGAYITFADDYNIYLDSSIAITTDMTIDGDTHSVTISGDSNNDGSDNVHLFTVSGAEVTLNNLTMTDGQAENDENYGGGLLVNDGTLYVYNSTLTNGYADNNGGAIYNKPNAQVTISDTLIMASVARLDGGGVYNDGGAVTVAQSTFLFNVAAHGGGLANHAGTTTINNSTFAYNVGGGGGGVYNDAGSSSVMTVNNSTFSGNTAGNQGGGIYNDVDAKLTLRNSIVANSAGNSDCFDFIDSTPITVSNSLIEKSDTFNGGCGLPVLSVEPTYGTDPLLAPFANYGGSQQTFALLPGSPALDRGDDATCESADQRGENRVGACDLGAFESQGLTLTLVAGDNQTANIYTDFAQALRVTVSSVNAVEPVGAGGIVTFTGPDDGATLYTNPITAIIDADGKASTTVTSNGTNGTYIVTATVSSAVNTGDMGSNVITFTLTNECTPLTRTVTNANDSGDGSLRQAISESCSGGTITFDNDYTIYLGSSLTLTDTLTIDGSGHIIAISGDSNNDGDRDVQPFVIAASGAVTLSNLSVISGTADTGGAIANSGELTLATVTVQDNYATSGGGAIYNVGALTISDSSVIDNDTPSNGTILNLATLIVQRTLFAKNSSVRGGALYHETGTATIRNSTITNNTADEGGAIHNRGTLTVSNVSMVDNTAAIGSAIHNWSGTLYLYNSLFNGNSNACSNESTLAANLNNLSQDGSCSSTASSQLYLADLGDYGGATESIALLPGNPAIDGGNASYCDTADQRRESRVGTCDIGAFESHGFQMSLTSGDNQGAQTTDDFASPLQVTIIANDAREPVANGGVTLVGPSSGAGLNPTSVVATIDATGLASTTVTANSSEGSYVVIASANGVTPSVTFNLTNTPCIGTTVTNANDSGAGSLRQAIEDVCGGGTISFDNDYTIYLESSLSINRKLGIDGAGHTVTLSGDTGNDGDRDVQPITVGSSGVVTITSMIVISGTDLGTGGGAIHNAGDLHVYDSLFQDNYANSGDTAGGGAIYNSNQLTVARSAFLDNEAVRRGGAIRNSATATVVNSTFSGNYAGTEGGAMYNSDGTVTVINNTITANNSVGTKGIHNSSSGTADLRNNLIYGNGSGGFSCFTLGTQSGNNNLISGSTNCPGVTLTIDPQLSTLDYYASDTPLYALQLGSPAIDAGDSSACSATAVAGEDQRSESRSAGTSCDIGAYEAQFVINLSSGDGQSTSANSNFADPLVVTLSSKNGEPLGTGSSIVTFSGPTSGASLDQSYSATIDASTSASVTVKANTVAGSYAVTATTNGVITPALFNLTNTNDAPVVSDNAFVVADTTAVNTIIGAVSASDLNGQSLSYAITAGNGDNLFAIDGSGQITQIGALNAAHQSAHTLTVAVSDGLTSSTARLDIYVNCVASPVVSNDSDSDASSLRWMISNACDGSTVTFADDYTIYLNSNIAINKTLTLDGSGHTIIVSGDSNNDSSRNVQPFKIGSSGVVTISQMSMVSGTTTTRGGAIHNSGTLTLDNVTISDNVGTQGGGGVYNIGALTVNQSLIEGNTSNGSGGGLLTHNTLTINGSTIRDNAGTLGGGFHAYAEFVTISNSTISDNHGTQGGGIYNIHNLAMTNSTISGNTATSSGGGIQNSYHATLNNVTISDNSAPAGSGGGFFNEGVYIDPTDEGADPNENAFLTLSNTIIANSSTGGDCVNQDGVITDNGSNLVEDGSCISATSSLTGDPLLATLADNGGPSTGSGQAPQTHALTTGSPAIDAGDPTTCESTDQRGNSRPVGAACDIGAFEWQDLSTPTPTMTPTPTETPTSTPTPTATDTTLPTATPMATATETATPTPTATNTVLPTATATVTPTVTATTTANATPQTRFTSKPLNPSVTAVSFGFSGSDTDGTVVGYECNLDGAGYTACTSPQSYSSLSAGSHTFRVRAVDNVGAVDATPSSYTWTVAESNAIITIVLDMTPEITHNVRFTGSLGTFFLDDGAVDDGDLYTNTKVVNVVAGSYTVNQRLGDNWLLAGIDCTPTSTASTDVTNKSVIITVVDGDAVTCTFAVQRKVAIGALSYHDLFRSGSSWGRRNSGDPYLTDWTMTLYSDPTTVISSGLTISDPISQVHQLRFTKLTPGTYVVCTTLPTGWVQTTPTTEVTGYEGKVCKLVTLAAGKGATLLFGQYESALVARSAKGMDELLTEDDTIYDLLPDLTEQVDAAPEDLSEERALPLTFFLPLVTR